MLTLALVTLRSRRIAAVNKGKRALNKVPGLSEVFKKLARFGGWLFGQAVSFFNLSFDRLWDILVQGYFALKTFDWNATDAALQQQIESNNKRMVTAAAQTIGTSLGWGAVRLANFFVGKFIGGKQAQAGKAVSARIPVLSARIGLALAEEGNEELQAEVRRFLMVTAGAQISNAFINFVLTSRRNEWFGMNTITKPQSNGSIAKKIEDKIEQLPKFWQQPVEELVESFEEAIIEAGYVVSYTIDDHVAAMRYGQSQEAQKTIEIKPHKDSEEKLTFTGSQSQVMQAVRTTLQGTYPLIENRDIGEYMGNPVNEQIKLEPQLRTLKLHFNEYEKPPFKRNQKLGKRAMIGVPDAKPGLTWQDLKSAVTRYNTGDHWVTVQFKNGRQMNGWFSSFSEGKQTLRELSRLSTVDLDELSFRCSTGDTNDPNRRTKRMHLVRATLLYPKRKRGDRVGIAGANQRLDLWYDTKPEDSKPFK